MRAALVVLASVVASAGLSAQDTTASGVRVGITYAPGSRPSLAVNGPAAPALADSVRTVLHRDLDFSDRFEITTVPAGAAAGDGVNLVVTIEASGDRLRVSALDNRSGQVVHAAPLNLDGGWRGATHRIADEIVRAVTGERGIAATALLFVRNGRIARVDADGAHLSVLRTAGFPSLSPAWSPDGRRMAYTAFVNAGQPIVVQDLAGAARQLVPGTEYGLNITPVFSPDGRKLAFAHGTEAGTDIYLSEQAGGGWRQAAAITQGRFADNLSPAWSPDGSRLAFISNRARTPQLYVMSVDGTSQEVLARFDFGATGQSSAPAWAPDGSQIAFHREVGGSPQIFVLDVATRGLRQLTGSGRNEDPSWAPDSRHLAFVSSRSGQREVWVLDLETGRLRQLTTGGGARLPAWSPRLQEDQ